MRFFKNFQTKKQLRKEIERLRFLNRPQINFVKREVQKISSCVEISGYELGTPIEVIKKQILHRMADELEHFVEWDIEDNSDKNRYGKIIKGRVYLAKRK